MLMQIKHILWKLLVVTFVAMVYAQFSGATEISQTEKYASNTDANKSSADAEKIGFRCPGKLFALRAGCREKTKNQEAIAERKEESRKTKIE